MSKKLNTENAAIVKVKAKATTKTTTGSKSILAIPETNKPRRLIKPVIVTDAPSTTKKVRKAKPKADEKLVDSPNLAPLDTGKVSKGDIVAEKLADSPNLATIVTGEPVKCAIVSPTNAALTATITNSKPKRRVLTELDRDISFTVLLYVYMFLPYIGM
jgi:hypothetical protein